MTVVSNDPRPQRRKPCLALMGEFSAGKSTLTKLLLGDAPLPVQVTATRLPPILITRGEMAAFAIGHDGSERQIDVADITGVDIQDTKLIRLHHPSETLEICDVIDMPGISDPNMSADVWMSVMDLVDCIVWCTQATQAWRQSEAATWEKISGQTNGNNLLLVTQIDKLNTQRDVDRILMRLQKETQGAFDAIYPMSILGAIAAEDDEDLWIASGAPPFIDHLFSVLLSRAAKAASPEAEPILSLPDLPKDDAFDARLEKVLQEHDDEAEAPIDADEKMAVLPRRVRVLTRMRGRTARPTPSVVADL